MVECFTDYLPMDVYEGGGANTRQVSRSLEVRFCYRIGPLEMVPMRIFLDYV